jgi:hypothetical protein
LQTMPAKIAFISPSSGGITVTSPIRTG